MKNLLVYIHPRKDFDGEHSLLAKIQIDNCFRVGWQKEDILLVTNFPYEYNGVKSLVVEDTTFCHGHPRASKWTVALELSGMGMIDDLMWCHDFDAFQLVPFEDGEPELNGAVAGFTDYGWSSKWNTGSVFFTPESMDIIDKMVALTNQYEQSEELSLMTLTEDNVDGINDRIKRLNITYNMGMRKVERNARRATKPIKVLHFHPRKPGLMQRFKPYMPPELLTIMADHGYAP